MLEWCLVNVGGRGQHKMNKIKNKSRNKQKKHKDNKWATQSRRK